LRVFFGDLRLDEVVFGQDIWIVHIAICM
jgi:hypothetical protein